MISKLQTYFRGGHLAERRTLELLIETSFPASLHTARGQTATVLTRHFPPHQTWMRPRRACSTPMTLGLEVRTRHVEASGPTVQGLQGLLALRTSSSTTTTTSLSSTSSPHSPTCPCRACSGQSRCPCRCPTVPTTATQALVSAAKNPNLQTDEGVGF